MAHFDQQRIWHFIKTRWFKPAKQQAFLEDIVSLLEDGISVNKAIEMMARISRGLTAELIDDTLFAIAAGQTFAEGMYGWFSAPIVEMIRAGEEGGTLIQAMHTAIEAIEQKRSAISALVSTLSYPLVVVIVCLGVVVFLNHSIFIDFRQLLPIKYWPAHAVSLMHFADFMQTWWWFIILVFVIFCVLLAYFLRYYTGIYRALVDKVPLLSLYRVITASRFMENLGMLVANGLLVKQALSILSRNATPYLQAHIAAMTQRLSGGSVEIGSVLDTGLIDKADIFRLQLVMQARSFENTLVRLGRASARRAHQQILVSGQVVSGILLFFVAALAFLMIFSIYDVGAVLGSGI